MSPNEVIKPMVKFALENATQFNWSIQGFGMLRLYMPGDSRLHIWDDRYTNTDVSLMHTHPWDFESLVVSGTLINKRYRQTKTHEIGRVYKRALLKCGPGGGLLEKGEDIYLIEEIPEFYAEGAIYSQKSHEIHVSNPSRGCITFNLRQRLENGDDAYVFWEKDYEWVSAEPRAATDKEVRDITQNALKHL